MSGNNGHNGNGRHKSDEPLRPLTPMQERFVSEYMKDLNATGAAERAGYSDASYGRQLLTLPHVKYAIERAKKQLAINSDITSEWITEQLKKEATYDGDGASHAARIKAIELLGDRIGYFNDGRPDGATLPPIQIFMPDNGRSRTNGVA